MLIGNCFQIPLNQTLIHDSSIIGTTVLPLVTLLLVPLMAVLWMAIPFFAPLSANLFPDQFFTNNAGVKQLSIFGLFLPRHAWSAGCQAGILDERSLLYCTALEPGDLYGPKAVQSGAMMHSLHVHMARICLD